MPLISVVGRKSAAVRLLTGLIYAILIAGAVTMVYPFLLMVSGSFKTDVDKNDFDVFPAFIHDDLVLYRKHLECKYNNNPTLYNALNRVKAFEFRTVDPPAAVHAGRVADWKEFEARVPTSYYYLGYTAHTGDRMRLWQHRAFRKHLMDLCGGDIQDYNRRFDAQALGWIGVGSVVERLTERRYQLSGSALEQQFYQFKAGRPTWFRMYTSLDGVYVQGYLEAIYGREAVEYNAPHRTDWKSCRDIVLPRTVPEVHPPPAPFQALATGTDAVVAVAGHAAPTVLAAAVAQPVDFLRQAAHALVAADAVEPVIKWAGQRLQRRDWEHFVREELNLQYLRIRPGRSSTSATSSDESTTTTSPPSTAPTRAATPPSTSCLRPPARSIMPTSRPTDPPSAASSSPPTTDRSPTTSSSTGAAS